MLWPHPQFFSILKPLNFKPESGEAVAGGVRILGLIGHCLEHARDDWLGGEEGVGGGGVS